MLVQQVTENVIAQLDFERIVRQIPVEDIVAQVDIEAVVARIDLGGVIRESTVTIGGEAVDAVREQGMALDGLARAGRRPPAPAQAAPTRIELRPTP